MITCVAYPTQHAAKTNLQSGSANFPHHFNSDTSTATALIFDTGFVPALIA
jgi:hypothetical protein